MIEKIYFFYNRFGKLITYARANVNENEKYFTICNILHNRIVRLILNYVI